MNVWSVAAEYRLSEYSFLLESRVPQAMSALVDLFVTQHEKLLKYATVFKSLVRELTKISQTATFGM